MALATARFLIDQAGRKPSALELQLYEHHLSIELDG